MYLRGVSRPGTLEGRWQGWLAWWGLLAKKTEILVSTSVLVKYKLSTDMSTYFLFRIFKVLTYPELFLTCHAGDRKND